MSKQRANLGDISEILEQQTQTFVVPQYNFDSFIMFIQNFTTNKTFSHFYQSTLYLLA